LHKTRKRKMWSMPNGVLLFAELPKESLDGIKLL